MIEKYDPRLFKYHPKGSPAPGSMVITTWDPDSRGTVLAVSEDDSGRARQLTIIWSRAPDEDRLWAEVQRLQIADQIDREIIDELIERLTTSEPG